MRKITKLGIYLNTTILSCSVATAAYRIDNIQVIGNKRVETATIHNYVGLKIGDEFTQEKQNKAIKDLYLTSFFDKIDVDYDHGKLIIKVDENKFISKVEIKGNSKIKTDLINKELLTRAGESLTASSLRIDVERIKELYKRSGRFTSTVEAKVTKLDDNRVKVTFDIAEGPKTLVKNIYFVGNENYTNSELRSIILTKQTGLIGIFSSNDNYEPERIEYDKELIKGFYESVGFANVRVLSASAELSPLKEYFTITYSIDEGEKYNFGQTTIDSKIQNIDANSISKYVNIKQGSLYNAKILDKATQDVSNELAAHGYPDVDVRAEKNIIEATKLVDIKIVIDRAEKVYINQINIAGNVKTEDKVIRREFKIAEGDLFNRERIEKGEQNIRNLDYFEKLNTNIAPTSIRDRYDLDVSVEEKSTSSIALDVGYNTSGGIFTRLGFTERNLVGTGRYLDLGVQVGKQNTNFTGGITEPYFMDKDVALSGRFFRNHSGRGGGFGEADQSYTLNSIGFTPSIEYNIKEDLSHNIEYTIKKDHLIPSKNKSDGRFLNEQKGKFTTSAIGQTITYDQLDSRVLPKKGYIISGSQELAGIGGDNKYLKHEIDSKYYYSVLNNKLTLKLAASVGDIEGIMSKAVRISDRFNKGDETLRGFENGGLGPRDKQTRESLGGQRFYTLSAELNFPLGLPQDLDVTGAAFIDAGNVFDIKAKKNTNYDKNQYYNSKKIRASVGAGFIWITRLAPIRIDYAIPIRKEKYDKKQNLHIRFSTRL